MKGISSKRVPGLRWIVALADRRVLLRAQRLAPQRLRDLGQALDRLGLGPVPGAIRVGVWAHSYGGAFRRTHANIAMSLLIVGSVVSVPVGMATGSQGLALGTLPGYLYMLLVPMKKPRQLEVPHLLTHEIASALVACGSLAAARTNERARALKVADYSARRVERAVLLASRRSGSVTVRSHRRRGLNEHARLVAAALRRATAELDREPDRAVHDLAQLLKTIGENYAKGRAGALLPRRRLRDLTPVRQVVPYRSVARAVGATALAGLGTWLSVHFKSAVPGVIAVMVLPWFFGLDGAAGLPAAILGKLPSSQG